MTLAEQTQRDAINIVSDVPVTFTFASVSYIGTRGALVTTERGFDGGILPEPDLTITTSLKKKDGAGNLVNRFATAPVLGEKLTLNGTAYRIDRIATDEHGSAIQFDLVSISLGADGAGRSSR